MLDKYSLYSINTDIEVKSKELNEEVKEINDPINKYYDEIKSITGVKRLRDYLEQTFGIKGGYGEFGIPGSKHSLCIYLSDNHISVKDIVSYREVAIDIKKDN